MLTPEQKAQLDGVLAQHPNVQKIAPVNDWYSQIKKNSPVKEPSGLKKIAGIAKAGLGGFAAGVGGIGLTAIDFATRKAIEALPDTFQIEGTTKQQMLENLSKAQPLQEQFKKEMGGIEHPTAFGAGQLGGEIATLAAPVSAVGKATEIGVKALGVGKKISKIARAGVEGAAFTKGMELTEAKPQTLQDYAINTGLNIAFPVGGMALKAIGEKMPARIINSLIKPLQKDFAYEKNPGQAVAELGITGNTFDELISKIRSKRDEIGARIGSVISQSQAPERIDLVQTLKPIDDALASANKTPRTNANLIQRLEAVKQDIMENTGGGTLQGAQDLKGLVGDLTKWTGNATDDQAVNKALKQVYGGIRGKMDEVLQKVLTSEQFAAYKKASEQYGNLLSAENAAVHRDKIVSRNDLISFGAKNAGLITALSTAIATGGASIPTILAGMAGIAIDKAAASPAFKTRLASLLTKIAPTEAKTFFEKVPTAKELFSEEQIKDWIAHPKMGLGIEDVTKKTNPAVGETALLSEARKYKTPEEFWQAKAKDYHGTNVDFNEFTKESLGLSTGAKSAEKGFFFTNNKDVAKGYGEYASERMIRDFVDAAEKASKRGDWGTYDKMTMKAEELSQKYSDPIVMETFLNIKNPMKYDAKGKGFMETDKKINNLIDEAKRLGHDSLIVKNLVDNVYTSDIPSTHTIVFDNKNIKTRAQLTSIWEKANKK